MLKTETRFRSFPREDLINVGDKLEFINRKRKLTKKIIYNELRRLSEF